jgi:hypothetical protein
MKTLTSNQVIDATKLTAKGLRVMCEEKVIKPIGGTGRGTVRRYTVPQAVGIAVAAKLRATERGCSLRYAECIVSAFADTTEDELEAEFAKGNTYFFFVPLKKDTPLLWPKGDDPDDPTEGVDSVDVRKCYEVVKKALESND